MKDTKKKAETQPAQNAEEKKETSPKKEEKKEPSEIEKLQDEIAKSKEQYLRLAAEYDNFRKRSVKERDNAFGDAKATVFVELLTVLDNFDRACANADASPEDYKKGVDMTHNQLLEVFGKFGVESFAEVNDKFDPNIHNAVMHIEDENLPENVVSEVFQKGYKIGEKVLRPAMVKVAN